jgi:hypothetical protein
MQSTWGRSSESEMLLGTIKTCTRHRRMLTMIFHVEQNQDWGLSQRTCSIATAPIPKSFYQTKDTGCLVGVHSECNGEDHKFVG